MKDGVSETVFQQQVVTLAKFYGWMVYHLSLIHISEPPRPY